MEEKKLTKQYDIMILLRKENLKNLTHDDNAPFLFINSGLHLHMLQLSS